MLLNCGVGEDSWNPLEIKEIQPVHPKGNQSWTFIGRTDAKAEAPILWPPDVKSWLIWKDPDAGKDWGQEEKGMTEDEMAGWHYQLDGHEFEQTTGVGEKQGSLVCCSPWGCKESDTTKQLNWTELNPLGKTLMLGKIKGSRKRGLQRMRWLDGISGSMDMSLSKLQKMVRIGKSGMLRSMRLQRVRHKWVTDNNNNEFFTFYSETDIAHLRIWHIDNLKTRFPFHLFS